MTLPPTTIALLFAALVYLLFINIVTYRVFREDKRRALMGEWRIPEAQLLAAAALGGVLGGRLAMVRFRHKTRKQPFHGMMRAIGLAYYGAAIVGLYLVFAPVFASHVATIFRDAFGQHHARVQAPGELRANIHRGTR